MISKRFFLLCLGLSLGMLAGCQGQSSNQGAPAKGGVSTTISPAASSAVGPAAPAATSSPSAASSALTKAPAGGVYLLKDLSQTLALWGRSGATRATVLHIDAHHDLLPRPQDWQVLETKNLLRAGNYGALDRAGLFYPPAAKPLYNSNNYLNMAYQLGIADSIYWVVPVKGTPSAEELAGFKKYLIESSAPSLRGEFEKLELVPPYLVGKLGGVPLTIGSLSDFKPASDAAVLVDIDLDFFFDLYKNPVAESYLEVLGKFVRYLQEKGMNDKLTSIAFSQHGGDFPIEQRYLGVLLKQMLANPTLLDGAAPPAWQLKAEATHEEYFRQYDKAIALYLEIIKIEPKNADAYFSLAMNQLASEDVEAAVKSMTTAYRIDDAYIQGFITAGTIMLGKKEEDIGLHFLKTAERLAPKSLPVLDVLGNAYHNLGDYPRAISYYQKVIATGHAASMTHAYLGDSYLLLDKPTEALTAYREALRIWRSRPDTFLDGSYWLRIGELEEKQGEISSACSNYRELIELFPDSPAELLAQARTHLTGAACQPRH